MRIRAALLAAATTIVLILVLGTTWARDNLTEGSFALQTRLGIIGQMQFQVWDLPSEIRGATVARLVVLVLLTAVLGGIAGRARPAAAFLGGWAALLGASVISAGVYSLFLDDRFDIRPGSDALDEFGLTASFGTPTGLWLGWLVGLAVMLGSLGQDRHRAPRRDTRPAPPTGSWPPPPPPPGPHPGDAPFGGDAPGAPTGPGSQASPGGPGAPVIGPPPDPDRTQVFGEPPAR